MDHYSLLGVKQCASSDEIRKAYQSRALALHPDKASRLQATDRGRSAYTSDSQLTDPFRQAQQAYEGLRDPVLRKAYDAKLSIAASDVAVSDSLQLDQMECTDGVWTHDCRCGGVFEVTAAELKEDGPVVIGCSGCSLHIQVQPW